MKTIENSKGIFCNNSDTIYLIESDTPYPLFTSTYPNIPIDIN